jgi:hypothetical protein
VGVPDRLLATAQVLVFKFTSRFLPRFPVILRHRGSRALGEHGGGQPQVVAKRGQIGQGQRNWPGYHFRVTLCRPQSSRHSAFRLSVSCLVIVLALNCVG